MNKQFFTWLEETQRKNNSLVCVGLDIDLSKTPEIINKEEDPVFFFNKQIIDATKDLVGCYKPQIAFYEALGVDGLKSLKKTVDYLHSLGIPVLVDAKRGDIDSTAKAYGKAIFDYFEFDAMTANPYMGLDSAEPLLEYKEKGIIFLGKTSNPGAKDFQDLDCGGRPLYQVVIEKMLSWNKNNNIGFVVGATYPEEMKIIREMAPDITFLIPGVGAQGGKAEDMIANGVREDGYGAIVNSSRGIIFASNGEDFAEAARQKAIELKDEINKYRS
ncbi:MAG: orotidine-5'-phosphate decarboxylase [Patescibacteria group bacterium]|nr:orotidine-5'-phosphate decarboxylase [Patescibacteria group bacterium]